MYFDDMKKAVNEARATISNSDAVVGDMARMIVGRLKNARVPNWILRDLKTELMKYNRHTMTWKD